MVKPADAFIARTYPKMKASQVLTEWGTDAHDAPSTLPTPPLFDATPSFASTTNRARVNNRLQIFQRVWSISEVQQAVAKAGHSAGIPNEVTHQIKLKTKELFQEVDLVILSEQIADIDDDTDPARMAGFFTVSGTQVADIAANAFTDIAEKTTAGVVTAFNPMLRAMWAAGCGQNIQAMLPPAIMEHWTNTFTGRPNSRVTVPQERRKIENFIESYMTSVNGIMVDFVPHRTMDSDGVALIDKDELGIAQLIPFYVKNDPASTTNLNGWMRWMCTLWFGNPAVHGGWKNGSTLTQ